MAKIHESRIVKKYGDIKDKFSGFMEKILLRNYEDIRRKTITIQSSLLTNQLKAVKQEIAQQKNLSETMRKIRVQEHAINIPVSIADARIIWAEKAKERGKMISDSLKEQITNNIKSVISKPEYTRARGKLTGTLKDQAILDVRDRMKKTFKNYTKVDSTIGIPRNIKAIVTTETRSIVNQTKHDYTQRLINDNPDISVIKRWIHSGNVWGAKNYKPRRYHKALHGTEIPFDQKFKIRDEKTSMVYLAYRPHDDSLPAEQVIGCQCNLQYIARKERVRESKNSK
jgi:hypothetical protein